MARTKALKANIFEHVLYQTSAYAHWKLLHSKNVTREAEVLKQGNKELWKLTVTSPIGNSSRISNQTTLVFENSKLTTVYDGFIENEKQLLSFKIGKIGYIPEPKIPQKYPVVSNTRLLKDVQPFLISETF